MAIWNTTGSMVHHALARRPQQRPLPPGRQPSPSPSQHQLAEGLLSCQGHLKAQQNDHGTLELQPSPLYSSNSPGVCCKGDKPRESLLSAGTIPVGTAFPEVSNGGAELEGTPSGSCLTKVSHSYLFPSKPDSSLGLEG